MVNLSDKQEQHLNRIKAAKAYYDQQLAVLDNEYKRQKDALKNPIRELVQEAGKLEIPVRQIHMKGLGFNYLKSMVDFLAEQTMTAAEQVARIMGGTSPAVGRAEVAAGKPIIRADEGKVSLYVTKADGSELRIRYSNTSPRLSLIENDDDDMADWLALDRETQRAVRDYGPGWKLDEDDMPDWMKEENE